MSILLRQRDAAQATLDHFIGKPLEWGRTDCAKIVIFHLRQLEISLSVAKAGRYSTPAGAVRALKRLGFTRLSEVLDDRGLVRIAPAARIVGDIVELPSVDGPGALSIAVGNGRIFGHHESLAGADVLQPVEMIAAWRPISGG